MFPILWMNRPSLIYHNPPEYAGPGQTPGSRIYPSHSVPDACICLFSESREKESLINEIPPTGPGGFQDLHIGAADLLVVRTQKILYDFSAFDHRLFISFHCAA